MENNIRSIARAFDEGQDAAALDLLVAGDFAHNSPTSRIVLLGLWRRAFGTRTAANLFDPAIANKLSPLFDRLRAAQQTFDFWPLLRQMQTGDALIGRQRTTKLMTSILWDALVSAPYGFQYDALSRMFLDGEPATFLALFEHLLSKDTSFVPDYWQVQSVIRSLTQADQNGAPTVAEMVTRAKRDDVSKLVEVYMLFAAQTHSARAFELAKDLTEPTHKRHVASYLLGASQSPHTMDKAVALHHLLTDGDAQVERDFMQARAAVNDQDWEAVLTLTQPVLAHPDLRNEAVCLRALANAHLCDHDNARAAISHVRTNAQAKWYLNARASLIDVAHRLIQDDVPQPNATKAPALSVIAGRPLAQSLWVGPRLRWIELLSMQSYLQNGWRYQLYCYEPIENVPDGVELMDAAAILPRSDIFVEGAASGIHKGSVGAFSDLFRYALLSKRGGMWTDTDVINLRRFDPDGARFISSEYSDAGLVGLNGAMMAAPAGDALQTQALEKSRRILDQGGLHFARIGPELLAESIGSGGLQGYTLMPTNFLNPIGWMETGRMLRPFDEVCASGVLDGASNIHVYTETWRLIGLSLKEPPTGDGFLAVLYDRLMNANAGQNTPVRDIVGAAA